ncbi:retrotransposable element Tf2, partial [Tanacetum coccineum]
RSLGLAACASLESKNEVCLLCEVSPKQIPAFDFICASLESILAIEDTWERERSGFAEEKVWGDIPVVTGFWGGKEDFLGELAVWSPEDKRLIAVFPSEVDAGVLGGFLECALGKRLTTHFRLIGYLKLLGSDYASAIRKGCENMVADSFSQGFKWAEINSWTWLLDLVTCNHYLSLGEDMELYFMGTSLKATFLQGSSEHYKGVGAELEHPEPGFSLLLGKWGQRLKTPFQAKWQPKLLGYDYEISYKKDSENMVADAFSRVSSGTELNSLVLTFITSDLMQQIKDSWSNDSVLQGLIQQLQNKSYVEDKYSWVDGILRRKDKIVVSNVVKLRNTIINYYHSDGTGGHSGTTGKTMIMVVVDRLSKYAHFMALEHPFTTSTISQVFLDNVYKLHGLPESIISDRDKTDGKTEVLNRCLECYLRCMTSEKPKEWLQWLALAEFCVVEKVDRTLRAREQALSLIKFHLVRDQDIMKSLADKHMIDRVFDVDTWVYLKLQPYRQVTIKQGQQNKLSSKYYGPF